MISKICNYIANIDKDKILHYIVSYIIFDVCISIFKNFNISNIFVLLISFVIVNIFIFGKEAIDEKTYNGWSWSDIFADYLGVISKLIVFMILTI